MTMHPQGSEIPELAMEVDSLEDHRTIAEGVSITDWHMPSGHGQQFVNRDSYAHWFGFPSYGMDDHTRINHFLTVAPIQPTIHRWFINNKY